MPRRRTSVPGARPSRDRCVRDNARQLAELVRAHQWRMILQHHPPGSPRMVFVPRLRVPIDAVARGNARHVVVVRGPWASQKPPIPPILQRAARAPGVRNASAGVAPAAMAPDQ